MTITVAVPLPTSTSERGYDVLVGAGARAELAALVRAAAPRARRAAIVTQEAIAGITADLDPGVEHRRFLIGAGEVDKSLATVGRLCSAWSQWGMTRNDVVIAVGGGLVTDVGGFAAACYHRGIAVVYVSTTLLGMIDAAIGGKTAVNLPEGKNLVGAFWQPAGVVCDTDLLASMPPRERRSGLGELAKYHFLEPTVAAGAGAYLPTAGPASLPLRDDAPLDVQVARCVALKAAVVAADERETGLRATLNYGHTLAHALEIATQFDLMHGEAVAIGLVYAAELAFGLGRIDAARVAEHRQIIGAYDLPLSPPTGLDPAELVTLMGRDKKALDGITFVLDGPSGIEQVLGVERSAIDDALRRLG